MKLPWISRCTARRDAHFGYRALPRNRSAAPKTRLLETLGFYLTTPDAVVPRDLRQFASVLPEGHPWEATPELIVKGHTLVPLLLHFAHPKHTAPY